MIDILFVWIDDYTNYYSTLILFTDQNNNQSISFSIYCLKFKFIKKKKTVSYFSFFVSFPILTEEPCSVV